MKRRGRKAAAFLMALSIAVSTFARVGEPYADQETGGQEEALEEVLRPEEAQQPDTEREPGTASPESPVSEEMADAAAEIAQAPEVQQPPEISAGEPETEEPAKVIPLQEPATEPSSMQEEISGSDQEPLVSDGAAGEDGQGTEAESDPEEVLTVSEKDAEELIQEAEEGTSQDVQEPEEQTQEAPEGSEESSDPEPIETEEDDEALLVADGGSIIPDTEAAGGEEAATEEEWTETETEEETEEAEEETEEETEEELEVVEQALDAGFAVSYSCSLGTLAGFAQGSIIYLFLPANAPSTVSFNFAGQIRSISGGTVNGGKITAALNGSAATVTVVLTDGSTRYVKLMKSSVPSLNIQLNGVTLAQIHQNKEIKYQGNSVFLTDASNPANNLAVGNVEIKGRGNSSWNRYEKKGYQIKFADKVALLGMPAAKKWCFIPSAGDGSLMRNKVAYELAGQAGSFAYTTEGRYVDLWVSGEYRGLYLVTEKVEIDKNRLNLKDPKGVLIELDNIMYFEEPVVYRSPVSQNVYVLKDAVDENSTAGFNSFCAAMVSFEQNIVNKAPWSTITRQIDARSFAEWYIVNEFLLNTEDLYTSFFFYKDGDADVIHAGPIWDFDTCEGIYGGVDRDATSVYFASSVMTNATRYSDMFHYLGRYLEFVDLVCEIYNEKYKTVAPEIITSISAMYQQITPSANMNYTKYQTLGKTTWKGNTVLSTFKANVDSLKNWLTDRLRKFIPYNFYTRLYTSGGGQRKVVIDDDYGMLKGARLALWSSTNGQDDLRWYMGVKSGSTWVISFDLGAHPGNGEYTMHTYGTYHSGEDFMISPTTFYLSTAAPAYFVGVRNSTATSSSYISTRGNGVEAYALVFNADYYAKKYPDVVKTVGNKPADLLNYFLNTGMSKQQQGCERFNVTVYKANYEDLQRAFGNNWPAYYTHYIQHGYAEGRNAKTLIKNDTETQGGSSETPDSGSQSGSSSSGSSSSGSSSSGSSSSGSSGTGTSGTTTTLDTGFKPVYGGVDYSLVFSAQQYYDRYPDLQKAIGKNAQALFAHFVSNGMREARIGKNTFDVKLYRSKYADLQKAFGSNWPAYYMHFIKNGYAEKRTAATSAPKPSETSSGSGTSTGSTSSGGTSSGGSTSSGSGTSTPATGIALVFNAAYYLNRYPDLKAAFGNDEAKALAHFRNNGMKEGRQGCAGFNPVAYRARYADLRKAFGNNWPAYYEHYMNCGAIKEKRIGN